MEVRVLGNFSMALESESYLNFLVLREENKVKEGMSWERWRVETSASSTSK
jgi:hypothetical protein